MSTSHHPWSLRAARAALVLLIAMASVAVVAEPASAARLRTFPEARLEMRLAAEHLDARAAAGVRGMTVWTDVREVARGWSDQMASAGRLRHNPSYTTQVGNASAWAENVAMITDRLDDGRIDAADLDRWAARLQKMWMGSSGHRRNILDARFDEFGVGIDIVRSGDRVTIWATVNFRRYDGSTRPSSARAVRGRGGLPLGGVPVHGDWNGDGVDTPGWYGNGTFYLSDRRDGSGTLTVLRYGRAGDIPVVGDWDGDGKDTIGVVRGNKWILRNVYKSGADDIVMYYGRTTDIPVVGDWDGNGTDTLGVVRGNKWILRNVYRSGADDIVMHYGRSTDIPVVGDWDGNGTDTLGVVRGDTWILRNVYRSGANDIVMRYGRPADHKVPGDHDGDGVDTVGIVRDRIWVLRDEYRRSAGDLVLRY